jgi:hypothetical protein
MSVQRRNFPDSFKREAVDLGQTERFDQVNEAKEAQHQADQDDKAGDHFHSPPLRLRQFSH